MAEVKCCVTSDQQRTMSIVRAKVGDKLKQDRNKLHPLHMQQIGNVAPYQWQKGSEEGQIPRNPLEKVHCSKAINVTLHFIVNISHFSPRERWLSIQ